MEDVIDKIRRIEATKARHKGFADKTNKRIEDMAKKMSDRELLERIYIKLHQV